jgi:hypothetical protein
MMRLGLSTPARFGLRQEQAERPSSLVPLEAGTCQDLMWTLRSIIQRGNVLFDWLDSERDKARSLGIEAIIVELLALVEGVRLRHIYDALEEAVESKSGCEITEEGLAALHRAERLIADAERRIPASAAPAKKAMILSGRSSGSLSETSSSSNTMTILAFVFVGTMGIAALGLAIYLATRK